MNLTKVEIEGKEYHAYLDILDDGYESVVLITYNDGDPIPTYVCICAAYDVTECVCGAWDLEPPEEYD